MENGIFLLGWLIDFIVERNGPSEFVLFGESLAHVMHDFPFQDEIEVIGKPRFPESEGRFGSEVATEKDFVTFPFVEDVDVIGARPIKKPDAFEKETLGKFVSALEVTQTGTKQ